jgi:replicative DNA helicase
VSTPRKSAAAKNAMTAESVEAEQAVLGALLTSTDAITEIAGDVQPKHFLLPNHRAIYQAMLSLAEAGKPTDVLLVEQFLEERGQLDEVGGLGYLTALMNLAPVSVHVDHYTDLMLRHTRSRKLDEGMEEAWKAPDPETKEERIRATLEEAETIGRLKNWDRREEEWTALLERLLSPKTEENSGLKVGIGSLDFYLNGLRPQQMMTVAARPGIGKTSFGVTAAHHVGVKGQRPVIFFSAEMSSDEIHEKLLAIETDMPWERMTSHELNGHDKERLQRGVERVKTAPIFVIECPGQTVETLKHKAKVILREYDVALVIVDYLQYVTAKGKRENRTQEVGSVARELKQMAMELRVPVLALAQLNRESEYRNKRDKETGEMRPAEPTLAEMGESSEIERTSNIVLILYKPNEPDGSNVEAVVAIVAKNRMGKKGRVTLAYDGPKMKFADWERRYDAGF